MWTAVTHMVLVLRMTRLLCECLTVCLNKLKTALPSLQHSWITKHILSQFKVGKIVGKFLRFWYGRILTIITIKLTLDLHLDSCH